MAVAFVASRRGAWGLGVFTLAVLACLIGLGIWQLQRKQEKVALIAALTQRLAAAPVALPPPEAWPSLTPERDEFRRMTLQATLDTASPALVFTSGSALRPDVTGIGSWAFVPVRTAAGQTVVVNLGFVPDGRSMAPAAATGAVTLTGYLRFPEQEGWFTPRPDISRRTWYAREPRAMAVALGWGEVAPFYLDLETPPPAAGWPKPGPLAVHLRDQHLQYALTWFGLAVVVLVTFAVWLFGQRRA
jgi:surfeit locus 1 family protein